MAAELGPLDILAGTAEGLTLTEYKAAVAAVLPLVGQQMAHADTATGMTTASKLTMALQQHLALVVAEAGGLAEIAVTIK